MDSLGAELSTLESEENTSAIGAEAELRAAVGEYTQERWIELSEATDTEIARLSSERSEATAELAQLQQLLDVAEAPRAGRAGAAGSSGRTAVDAAGMTVAAPAGGERASRGASASTAAARDPAIAAA